MTTTQIIALIDSKIQTGGRKTTAALTREVLAEMANDNDAIIALQALSLIAFSSDLGPPLGKSLYTNGFNSTPANHSFFRMFNATQAGSFNMWIDNNGLVRVKKGVPSTHSDGYFIQPKASEIIASDSVISIGYVNYVQITGSSTISLIETRIKDAASGSIFPDSYELTIEFKGAITLKHDQAPSGTSKAILLASSIDLSAVAGDMVTLKYNGTAWKEVSRALD